MMITNNEEFKSEIRERSCYKGRAMAFYPDGRDYGMVTMISVRAYIANPCIFVFDERTGEVLEGVVRQCTQTKHQCGRTYEYTCTAADGEIELYISRTV